MTALVWAALLAQAAVVPVDVFALHIGVNRAPKDSAPKDSAQAPLRFADDDAVRFFRFSQQRGVDATLATVLDATSERTWRSAQLPLVAPTQNDVEAALASLRERMQTAQKQGHEVVFHFSYAGHGQPDGGLTLLDATVDEAWLKAHVLSLPATQLHLWLDACNAAGSVDGRGSIVREVDAGDADADVKAWLLQTPHVGAVLSSRNNTQSHEWSKIQGGVFTHEVLSALSGGADINADGAITYGEVSAFIAAANRTVVDARARLDAVVVPPALFPLTAIVKVVSQPRTFILADVEAFGHVVIEREDGVRLLDVHNARSVPTRLQLPANEDLVVIQPHLRAKLRASGNTTVSMHALRFAASPDAQSRDIASALDAGLFVAPLSAAYYQGHVDSLSLAAVPPAPLDAVQAPTPPAFTPVTMSLMALSIVSTGVTVAAGAVATVAFVEASTTTLERPAHDAQTRYGLALAVAGVAATLTIGSALGLLFAWPTPSTATSP